MYSLSMRNSSLYLLIMCLVIAFFNLTLRLDVNQESLFRLAFPFMIISLAVIDKNIFIAWMFWAVLISAFGSLGMFLSGYDISFSVNFVFYVHYLTVLTVIFCAGTLLRMKGVGYVDKFLVIFWCFFLVLGFVDLFFGLVPPNTVRKEGVIRAMTWNENDYSLVIAAGSIYFLFYMKRLFFPIFSIFSSFIVALINDSKIIFLMLVFCLLVFVVTDVAARKFFSTIWGKLSVFFVWIMLPFVFVLFLYNYGSIQIGGYGITELILDPLIRILLLEPYGIGSGSLTVRTDMTIYALKSIFDSYGLGIGFGNTLNMIETGRYGFIIWGAKSIHNFPLQVATELGIYFMIVFAVFLSKFMQIKDSKVLLILLVVSLSQSVGAFSNYYFIFVLGVVIFRSISVRQRS